MKQLNLAICGAGWMSGMCCDAISETEIVYASAVYARDIDKAATFAKQHGIAEYTNDYEQLLTNPKIDAVYIATTNETHFNFAQMAILAGKAVLLEKPFTLDYDQALALTVLAKEKQTFLMEAMWSRFIPGMQTVAAVVKSGAIGMLRCAEIQTGCILTPQKNPRVFRLEQGGGALVDIGVYPLHILQLLTGETPCDVTVKMKRHPQNHVDVEEHITLNYPCGFQAQLLVTCEKQLPSSLSLVGSEGTLTVEDYVLTQGFTITADGKSRFYDSSCGKGRYVFQLEHFARCIEEQETESFVVPLGDTLMVMKTLDSCRRAANYNFN